MAQKYDVIAVTLGALAGYGGTFTASYPSGRTAEDYAQSNGDHFLISQAKRPIFARSGDFTVTFGASSITIVITTSLTYAAGETVYLNADRAESGMELVDLASPGKMSLVQTAKITLGTPATAVAAGYFASQNLTAAGVASTSGTVTAAIAAASLAGVADVPRNVVAAWTGTAVITVTGVDEYGAVLKESSASGTSFTGKKAFKRVTGISVSADVTGLTVGTGVVLGLPVYLDSAADVVREKQDNATATAGTITAGVIGTATATTGDVRGTYSPNSAPNGSRVYELIAEIQNPGFINNAQFSG